MSKLLQKFTRHEPNIAQFFMFRHFVPLAKFILVWYNVLCEGLMWKEFKMATTETTETQKVNKSKFNDEFENYLKKQCLKTTFNGSELESFSWYRKVLGLA